MGSHCAPIVNKTQLRWRLIQVLDEFGSNPVSSVNSHFAIMLTQKLIQDLLTLWGRIDLNIQGFDIGEGGAQGFGPFR
jgi:hypothetical protein